MPVFVEWRWKKRTKSFLVIFHFYDDFSKSNLRLKKFEQGTARIFIESSYPNEYPWEIEPKKAWMTWSPSHPELALLMELLSYANLINGLKEAEKRKLKIELQGRKPLIKDVPEDLQASSMALWDEIGKDKKTVIYYDSKEDILNFCVELCPEYIDYIRKLLEPYLK